jgi:hypothetical protein
MNKLLRINYQSESFIFLAKIVFEINALKQGMAGSSVVCRKGLKNSIRRRAMLIT